ncbi:unnamed protein product, partial [Rotaria sp. Silwood2]
FPPQVNNKVLELTDEERRILNYGPKFVPENPKQALDRLEEEISVMKDKVAEAWRRETHTIGKNPILVEQFANRLEEELRNKINEGRAQDPIVEKALERFQKEQKKDAELPHLYYNPKDHKVGEPLRPIVSGMKSPTQKISAFLDQIIRSIFDR